MPKIIAERSHLGDTRLRIRTEMNTTHKLDEMATPEMTAKAWDDYLRRCGAGAYISARYGSSVRDATLSPSSATRHSVRVRVVWTVQPHINHDPFGRVWLRRPELTETDIRGCHIPPRQPGPRRMASRPCE